MPNPEAAIDVPTVPVTATMPQSRERTEAVVGQRIVIEGKTVVDNAAVFATNRSFTGTDGEGFANAEEAGASGTFPAQLAAELFEADTDLSRVYIDQNALVLERASGWSDDAVVATSKVIEDFFLFYPDQD
jgi:hypothetical protein